MRILVQKLAEANGPLQATALGVLAALYTLEQDDRMAQVTLDRLVRSYPGTQAAFYGQLSLFALHLDAGRVAMAADVLQAVKPQSREEAFELAAAQTVLDLETDTRAMGVQANVMPVLEQTQPVEARDAVQAETASPLEVSSYPNPFNPVATIQYALPVEGRVVLKVYDVLGREVARLVDGPQQAGRHRATFDASHLPSGTYLYRLEAAGQVITNTLQLLK